MATERGEPQTVISARTLGRSRTWPAPVRGSTVAPSSYVIPHRCRRLSPPPTSSSTSKRSTTLPNSSLASTKYSKTLKTLQTRTPRFPIFSLAGLVSKSGNQKTPASMKRRTHKTFQRIVHSLHEKNPTPPLSQNPNLFESFDSAVDTALYEKKILNPAGQGAAPRAQT